MASFKALCLAGVASLAATVAASAADLLLPPPPPPIPALPPVVGGNWYLRGDVGVGIADLRTKTSTFDYYVPDARYENHTLDDSAFIDAGVGYRINDYFRVDVTGEYRAGAHYSAIESYNQGYYSNPQTGLRGYDVYNGQIRSVAGLVNGYVSPGTWYGFSPFVGAGFGVAEVSVKGLTDQGGGFGYAADHSQTNFAWAVMAGLDFAVTPNLTVELGYRYLDLGNVSSGTIVCQNQSPCPNEVQHYHLASNDIRLGFRYMFADFTPAPRFPVVARY